MKTKLLFLFLLVNCFSLIVIAQDFNHGFNYQAVIRDDNGEIFANQEVDVIFSILYYGGFCNGCSVYSEQHVTSTNDFGMINLVIGTGWPLTSTSFEVLPWDVETAVKVEINIGNGWVNMGSEPLVAVPHAMYAHQNWGLNGNSGTEPNGTWPDGDYIGTSDYKALRIKTDASTRIFIEAGGDVGVGTSDPFSSLHIDGGVDAVLATDASGYCIIGDVEALNMVLDNNEIISRSNGAANELYLNAEGGGVVINSATSTSHELLVNGTAAKPGGGSWTATSDERLKENVEPYNLGLEEVMKIEPVTYHYIENTGHDTKVEHVGVIAQDVQKIAPDMVAETEMELVDGTKGNYLSVDPSAFTYMLINSIQEQQKMIELQQKQIDTLKMEIQAIQSKQ